MCGKFQAPLRLLIIWAIIFLDICQSARNGPIWKFFNFLLYKKLPTPVLYFGPHIVGVSDKKRSAKQPNFKIIQHFPVQNLNGKKAFFNENNCQLLYLGPHNPGGFEQIGGVCRLAQNEPILNENSKREYFIKKLASNVFRAL